MAADPGAFAALDFAGHRFAIVERTALFWPAHRALIVADLHLEKGSSYAANGQFLPPYDSLDTLARLRRAAEAVDARAIWCLGDSFHDHFTHRRMMAPTAQALRALAADFAMLFIAGNHDGVSGAAWGAAVADDHVVDGLVLRHESDARDARPELSGHYHPKLRLAGVRARPCFVLSARRLVLPAFGSYTGGLDCSDPAIAAVMGGPYAAIVAAAGRARHVDIVPQLVA